MSYKREASDLDEFVADEAQRKINDEKANNQGMNKYSKVLLAAQRTKQLQNDARPRVRMVGAKVSRIALIEIEQGLIKTKGSKQAEGKTGSVTPPITEPSKPTKKLSKKTTR